MKQFALLCLASLSSFSVVDAGAEISFISASNPNATYIDKESEMGDEVFLFNGLQFDETTELQFAVTGECPFMGISAGSKFEAQWTCADGILSATISNKGGMGWDSDERYEGALWIGWSSLSAEQQANIPSGSGGMGLTSVSVFGDIYGFNTNFNRTASGTSFEVEFKGDPEGAAHFIMDLPAPMVQMLGGVLGFTVQGKPYPFGSVVTNEDGGASMKLDVPKLKAASRIYSGGNQSITKKIAATERQLSIAVSKSPAKAGTTAALAMCTGKVFTAGSKVPVTFTLGGKSNKSLKAGSFTLDKSGCSRMQLKIPKGLSGNLGAQVTHLGKKAKLSLVVTK